MYIPLITAWSRYSGRLAGPRGLPLGVHMQSSKIIEIDGVFVGAALHVSDAQGWRFVAADTRVDGADGVMSASLEDAQMAARRAFFTSRVRAVAAA